MSSIETDTFWEWAWDKYSDQYLAECRAIGHQADLADFQVWLEDKDLIPEYIDEG